MFFSQGYDFTYTISEDGSYAVINLGTIDATNGDWVTSLGITATVDTDPEPATGTIYELTEDDIVYSTTVTVVDRDLGGELEPCTLDSDNCAITMSDMTLTSTTDDTEWEVEKTPSGEIETTEINGTTYIVAAYEITMTLDNMTQLANYARNGRVNFDAFTLTDTPVMTDDETGDEIYPVCVVVSPGNFSGSDEITGSLTNTSSSVSSVSISQYATAETVTVDASDTETIAALASIEDSVPVLSTYTVTVYYLADDCDSTFYDAQYYTVENTVSLSYVLDYEEGTEPVSGSSEDAVSDDYENITEPAVLNLSKYINSIFGGGNYVTEADDLDADYTGTVTFTLADSSGNNADVWAYISDAYVKVSNVITMDRGQIYVTISGGSSPTAYDGALYLEGGSYSVTETSCEIEHVEADYFTVDGDKLDGNSASFTVDAGNSVTVVAYNTEQRGSIAFTKYEKTYAGTYTTTAVKGAQFTLYDENGNVVDTATSDDNGKITFSELAVGTYTLKETKAASGYLLDRTEYAVTVSANTITYARSGEVYNTKNQADLTFVKYLFSVDSAGNLTHVYVPSSKLADFVGAFELQYRIGEEGEWETYDTESISLDVVSTAVSTYSSQDTLSLPVYYVADDGTETLIYYRIVEKLPSGYEGYKYSGDISYTVDSGKLTTDAFTLKNGDLSVSLTNYTPGEISATKYYYNVDESGYTSEAASGVTLYLLAYDSSDNTYTIQNSQTTDSSGAVTLTKVPLIDSDGEVITYYWAEEVSSEYVLQDSKADTVVVDGYTLVIRDKEAYATAYDSTYSLTELYNLKAQVRLTLEKRSTASGNALVGGAAYTIYQVDENGSEVYYTKGTVGSTTLILDTGYVYRVYETSAPDGYSDLSTYSGETTKGKYITIDLENVSLTTESNGVKYGTSYGTYTLYNTPYPTVTLTKYLVDGSGSQTEYDATFTVYYSTDGETWYEYSDYSTYIANSPSGYLEPGYYYAFVETVEDGNLDPADNDNYYKLTSSCLKAKTITIGSSNILTRIIRLLTSSGNTAFAFVTTTKLEAGVDYDLGTLLNYKNEGSLCVYKESATDNSLLEGATFKLYYYDENSEEVVVGELTTGSNGSVTFAGLKVYDDNGDAITYCLEETDAPEGYFADETVYEVTLTEGTTFSMTITDEEGLTVSVPVKWEDCYYKDDPEVPSTYSLAGATVYCYVKNADGTYTLKGEAVSDENGYATFSGLSHSSTDNSVEYVFVLGDSGADTNDDYYPLYASEDDSKIYADGDETLSESDLENYVYVSYTATSNLAETEVKLNDDYTLLNHKLYFQVSVQKYCTTSGHDDNTKITITTLPDGTVAYYVNGAIFYLYQQELSDEELEELATTGTLSLTYDTANLTRVDSGSSGEDANTSGSQMTGYLTLDAQTYDSRYVYWLVEAVPATGHTWPTGTSYYRILLYASELPDLYGTITSDDATDVQTYEKNTESVYEVENIHWSGSHEYFKTTVYMNKWGTEWDAYGNASEDYFPLNSAYFIFSLSNGIKGFELSKDMSDGDTAVRAEYDPNDGSLTKDPSENTKGQFGAGTLQFAKLYNDWLVYVVNDSGANGTAAVSSISDITSGMLSDVNWSNYTDMLYTSRYIDASVNDLLDLADDNGSIAIQMYDALVSYLDTNGYGSLSDLIDLSDTSREEAAIYKTYIEYMENVMSSTGSLHSNYGYVSYYAHITFSEDSAVTGYDQNTTIYELYVQFQPTGEGGSVNTKYFYLDSVDRDGYYYGTEPVQDPEIPIDMSMDNTTKVQIGNVKTWTYTTTITKYGYTLTKDTTGLTDAQLDTYFAEEAEEATADPSYTAAARTGLSGVTFAIQRYDTETGTWRYYVSCTESTSESVSDYVCTYTDNVNNARQVTTGSDGSISVELPIGHYRLIELNAASGYENIPNGDSVDINNSSDTTMAACYFWVTDSSNEVHVYDPDSVDLTIQKASLTTGGNLSGVTYTLTGVDVTYTASRTTSSGGSVTFTNLPCGTYTVTETVASGSGTTAEYFIDSFTITVGYTREAETGTAYTYTTSNGTILTDVEYATVVTGVTASRTVDSAYEKYVTITTTDNTDDVTLTVTNPRTGQLIITKQDANDASASLAGAVFTLYYRAFTTETSNPYQADVTTAPSFDLSDTTGWTKLDTTHQIGSGNTVTASNLTPGWYAVVESTTPSGYETAEPVVVYVSGDMTISSGGQVVSSGYQTNSVTINDTKKVNLNVQKTFALGDYYSTMNTEVMNYTVTYGLYVKGTDGTMYSADTFGLVDSAAVTIQMASVDASNYAVVSRTGTWSNVIQMQESLNQDGTYTATFASDSSTTCILDGYYYIKEESVKDSGQNEVTDDWWISAYSISPSGSMSIVEDGDYYKVTGMAGNTVGTVSFTNSYGYATVTILKTDSNNDGLAGATFAVYTDAEKTQKVTDATITDNGNGTYTIVIPVQSLTGNTYYIYEESAPQYYTVKEEPLTVSLKSGDVKAYNTTGGLTMTDSNGIEIMLRKFDNVVSNAGVATGLNGVTFVLYRSTWDTSANDWGDWELVKTSTTQTPTQNSTDYNGVIDFGAQVASDLYQYMVVEVAWDDNAYVGLETIRNVTYSDGTFGGTATEEDSLTTATIEYEGTEYTGYVFQIPETMTASTYYLEAFNEPLLDVSFSKESGEDGDTAVPTAALEVYAADGYTSGQSLTDEQIETLMAGALIASGETTTASGASSSTVTFNLPAGTYLVVETSTDGTSDNGYDYTINKEDARTCWYQIVTVEIPTDGSKTVAWGIPFVNVTESYDLKLTKTTSDTVDNALLTEGTSLTYELAVDVDVSGPINKMKLTDDGLTVTEVYASAASDDTTVVTGTEAAGYLNGMYSITSVQIPSDAYYEYENLIFDDSTEKESFTISITATVTFAYSDGSNSEVPLTLDGTSGGYMTATSDSGKKAVSFTVTWSDAALLTQTGYDLGSDFTISSSNNPIKVNVTIDGQAEGSDAYAVAKIVNTADVSYAYYSWTDQGTKASASEKDDSTVEIMIPNVEAAELTLTKSVENTSSAARNATGSVIIGDKLLYTITLSNASSTVAMENPVIIDLLPQGLEISTASESIQYAGNLQIITENSGLEIEEVQLVTQDGYNLLAITTTGFLAAGGTVQLTLEASMTTTIVNYLTSSADISNTAWVTSTDSGTKYKDNTVPSVFKSADTLLWAEGLGSTSADQILQDMLDLSSYYGYLTATAPVSYIATDNVSVLKEIQGDQDGDVWSRSGKASVTDSESTGWVQFRLTMTNGNDQDSLHNLMVMDVIPQEGGLDFHTDTSGSSTNRWTLVYSEIESVIIRDKNGNETPLTEGDDYTIWYYTEALDDSGDVNAMMSAFETKETYAGNWTTTKPADGSITAFAIVVDNNYSLAPGAKLIVTYKTTVPEMSDDDLEAAIHQATYNCYTFCYTKGSSTATQSQASNRVYAVLSSEPVDVGGMFWIDADGDGIQDAEDVTLSGEYSGGSSGSASDILAYSDYYNSRTNYYADYAIVSALLNTASVSLRTYTGLQLGETLTAAVSGTSMWRFHFTGLDAASLSSNMTDEADAYDESGIIYSKLAGVSSATYYQLVAAIGGVSGVKYSVTTTRAQTSDGTAVNSIYSINPSSLYDTSGSSFAAYMGSVLADSNVTGTSIIDGTSTTVTSEKFFLYATSDGIYDLSKDIGLVLYRDLEITKQDSDGAPVKGTIFKVYGPYAAGTADTVETLDESKLIATLTTDSGGKASLEDLLYFQEYIIVEVSTDEQYDLASADADSTNVTDATNTYTGTDGDGNTVTYAAWILNIPSDAKTSEVNPTSTNTQTTDHVTVTNYNKMTISLTKIDGVGIGADTDFDSLTADQLLSGAVFQLYDPYDVSFTSTGKIQVDSDDALYTAISNSSGEVIFYTVNLDDGSFNYELLESGTYYLVETKAPGGYTLLARNYWLVEVDTKTQTFTLTSGISYSTTDADGNTKYYIPNYTQYTLPSTGGYSVPMLWITLFGCVLIFTAAGLWMCRKRKKAGT
ncbi:MAG: hypothetical protein LUG61_03810 [Lachnospiraceae bacterium]|nr:hypothetical protein [Lachnospiraceae bacterium]